MIKEMIQGVELSIPEAWNEIKLRDFMKIMDLYAKYDDMVEEEFIIKMIAVLTGTSPDFYFNSDLTDDEVNILIESLAPFREKMVPEKADSFEINGTLYSYNIPDKLTFGENVSIKILEKQSKSQYEGWLNILSIIIRPATESQNEFGDTVYKVEPFNGDIDIIKRRKELLKSIPCDAALWIIEAFTSGKKLSS